VCAQLARKNSVSKHAIGDARGSPIVYNCTYKWPIALLVAMHLDQSKSSKMQMQKNMHGVCTKRTLVLLPHDVRHGTLRAAISAGLSKMLLPSCASHIAVRGGCSCAAVRLERTRCDVMCGGLAASMVGGALERLNAARALIRCRRHHLFEMMGGRQLAGS
jgi:hypothetical protein